MKGIGENSGLFKGTRGAQYSAESRPEWELDEKTGRKRCSACKSEWTGGEWAFCPVCGAAMKEKD